MLAYTQVSALTIKKIRSHFQYINNFEGYKIVSNQSEPIASDEEDSGDGSLSYRAFIKNDSLLKVFETSYTASHKHTTEFYFWQDSLFFVFSKVQRAAYDSLTTSLNFNSLETVAESRIYINKLQIVKRTDTGDKDYFYEPHKRPGDFCLFPDDLRTYFEPYLNR